MKAQIQKWLDENCDIHNNKKKWEEVIYPDKKGNIIFDGIVCPKCGTLNNLPPEAIKLMEI